MLVIMEMSAVLMCAIFAFQMHGVLSGEITTETSVALIPTGTATTFQSEKIVTAGVDLTTEIGVTESSNRSILCLSDGMFKNSDCDGVALKDGENTTVTKNVNTVNNINEVTDALTDTNDSRTSTSVSTTSQPSQYHSSVSTDELSKFEMTDAYTTQYDSSSWFDVERATSSDGVFIVAAPHLQHFYIGIGVTGMIANTVVILSIWREKKLLRSLTNQLILNQSFIDLLASSLVWTVHVFYNHLQVPRGLARLIFCKFWLSRFLMWGMFQASTHNLVVLTLERYFAIVHPIFHRKFKKPWLKNIVFMLVWLVGPLSDGVFNVSAAYITPEGHCALYSMWGGALLQMIRGCLTFVGNFLLPFFIILFCHVSILWVLKKAQRDQNETATGNRDVQMTKAVRNVVRTLVLVSVCFIVCWAFNQILFFSFNLGLQVDFTGGFYHFTVILAFSNCSINPFIYSLNYRPVKLAARKLFCGSCRKSATSGTLQMSSSSRQCDSTNTASETTT